MLPGAASAASIEAFCAQYLPWRSANAWSATPAVGAAEGTGTGRDSSGARPQQRKAASDLLDEAVAAAKSDLGSATACLDEGPVGEDDLQVCDAEE